MPTRRKIPAKLEAKLLADNLHACCVCHGNNLHVQIHHIDGNPANNKPENLAVLCLNCHSKASGNEGLGKEFSELEIKEYKKRWESQCETATTARAATVRDEFSIASQNSKRRFEIDDLYPFYFNMELVRGVGKSVGVDFDGHLNLDLLEQLIAGLDRAGKIHRTRPKNFAEYNHRQLIYETVDATKVIFPHAILTATTPKIEELAVWVADPDKTVLESRSDDRYDFSGTFLYLVTPLYQHKMTSTFYSGCSALQVISNVIAGKPFINTDWNEVFGRKSYLHPTEKLKSMGGIVIDRRPIQTLYRCRDLSDEQSFNIEERAYRGHDLLAYPLFISNSEQYLDHLARNPQDSSAAG